MSCSPSAWMWLYSALSLKAKMEKHSTGTHPISCLGLIVTPPFFYWDRQMFSSYPTTTLVPTRRAQTPPVSSLPTSPSDEVGRRQSLTSPDSQQTRVQNRSGTCKCILNCARLSHRNFSVFSSLWAIREDSCGIVKVLKKHWRPKQDGRKQQLFPK